MFDDPSFSSPLCVSLHVSPVARIADNAASCVPNACEMTPKIWNEFSPLLQKQNQKKKKKNTKRKKNESELEIRRVGGSGYMPLGQAECCDLEDGKKSTNVGKVAEKSKDKTDEDVCSKLSRCCLLSWSTSRRCTIKKRSLANFLFLSSRQTFSFFLLFFGFLPFFQRKQLKLIWGIDLRNISDLILTFSTHLEKKKRI